MFSPKYYELYRQLTDRDKIRYDIEKEGKRLFKDYRGCFNENDELTLQKKYSDHTDGAELYFDPLSLSIEVEEWEDWDY